MTPTIEQLVEFANNLQVGYYTKDEIHKQLFKPIETKPVVKVEVTKPVSKLKTKSVTELKTGDIIWQEGLQHPFLILNVYKTGLIKCVALSSVADSRTSLIITCRFLNQVSYVRLTVSICETNLFLNQWVGNIPLSQVKLVKSFLKQNKL